jgi:hypothetical protein
MENASSKVVFRLSHEENLKVMAQWLFMGVMNPDEIKHKLYSTKVMSYREEMRTSYTKASSLGGGEFSGTTASDGQSGIVSDHGEHDVSSWSKSDALSGGDSSTWTESESETTSSVLMPVMGKELAHVQFRTLEEQIFRSMAVLFDQKQRQCVARLVGMNAPVSLYTPDVIDKPSPPARTKRYIESCYKSLPFVLPQAEAQKQIAARAENFVESLLHDADSAPVAIKRKLR